MTSRRLRFERCSTKAGAVWRQMKRKCFRRSDECRQCAQTKVYATTERPLSGNKFHLQEHVDLRAGDALALWPPLRFALSSDLRSHPGRFERPGSMLRARASV